MSTLDDTIGVVLELLQDLDTPRALTVSLLIRAGEWVQLSNLEVDPAQYFDHISYAKDAIATEILRKCKDLPGISAREKRTAAVGKWFDAEKLCALTNVRFANYLNGYYPDVDSRVVDFLHNVKKRIARVLGRLPNDLGHCKHGKGATYLDVGTSCTVPHKMQSRPTITADARSLLPLIEQSAWIRAVTRRDLSDPLTVRGNRFTTVPKTVKIDRAIAVEPSINIYLQLGVGQEIRKRLRDRASIDLDNGQELHRRLAALGSVNDTLATLDLSSASDTLARNVVEYLLPVDWFELLNSLRSVVTVLDKRTYRLEKFSSMGNGFTFELETLIFWAISQELDPNPVSVYGDDIIVTAESYADVTAALRFFGFIPNPKKCYPSGSFRESCGGDFFDGFNVRPFYLKELPHDSASWMSFANGLWWLNRRIFDDSGRLDHRIRRSYIRCLGYLPSDIRRLKGPPELGDLCLAEGDSSRWRIRVKDWIRYVEVYLPITRGTPLRRFDPDVQLASALYGVPSQGAVTRNSVQGYKKRWIAFS